jgi:hypothetical protein
VPGNDDIDRRPLFCLGHFPNGDESGHDAEWVSLEDQHVAHRKVVFGANRYSYPLIHTGGGVLPKLVAV